MTENQRPITPYSQLAETSRDVLASYRLSVMGHSLSVISSNNPNWFARDRHFA